jgi:transcriptional regulator MraZ
VFRGHFQHTIDPKGRLSIPAKFRDALSGLGEQWSDKLVIVPVDDCLEIHPLPAWEELIARVSAMPEFDSDVEDYQRFYTSRGFDVTIDPQGRIQIPPDYRERAGLVKNVLILGLTKRFEVWDTERWASHERLRGMPITQIRERLAAKARLAEAASGQPPRF